MNGPFRLPYPWWNSLMFAPFILSWSILVRTSERFSLKTIFLFHTCNQRSYYILNPIHHSSCISEYNRSNHAHSNDMDWYFKYSNDWSIVGYIDQSSDENFTWLVVDCMLLSIVKWSNSKKEFESIRILSFHGPYSIDPLKWIMNCYLFLHCFSYLLYHNHSFSSNNYLWTSLKSRDIFFSVGQWSLLYH